jgi:hypothetical protein
LWIVPWTSWIRHDSNNTNSDADATDQWWPAVYCESHTVAVREFGDRMTVPLKRQAAVKTHQEERTKTCIPCIVRLTGKGSPILHLKAVSAVDNGNESEWLRRDFMGSSFGDFCEQYERTSKESDSAYRTCVDELMELVEQAFIRNRKETVETVEASISPVEASLTLGCRLEKLLTRRQLFQQSELPEEQGDILQAQGDLFLPRVEMPNCFLGDLLVRNGRSW